MPWGHLQSSPPILHALLAFIWGKQLGDRLIWEVYECTRMQKQWKVLTIPRLRHLLQSTPHYHHLCHSLIFWWSWPCSPDNDMLCWEYHCFWRKSASNLWKNVLYWCRTRWGSHWPCVCRRCWVMQTEICEENEHSECMWDMCGLTTLCVPWRSFDPSQMSNLLGLLIGMVICCLWPKPHHLGPLDGSTLLTLSQYFRLCMHSTRLLSKCTVLFLLLKKKIGNILSIALLWKQHQIEVSRCALFGQH